MTASTRSVVAVVLALALCGAAQAAYLTSRPFRGARPLAYRPIPAYSVGHRAFCFQWTWTEATFDHCMSTSYGKGK